MTTIINNYKYSTDTASLLYESKRVYTYKDNNSMTNSVYQNSKLAFFNLITEIDKVTGETNQKIIPMTKKSVQEFLISEEQYDLYEKIFGEFDEPEGEDYIPEDIQCQIETEVEVAKQIEEHGYIFEKTKTSEEKKDEVKNVNTSSFSFFHSLKLLWACGTNNLLDAKEAILNGADCNFKNGACLVKAVVNKNLSIIKLLIDNNADLTRNDYKAIKLSFCTGDTDVIKLLCHISLSDSLIMYGIERCSRLKDTDSVKFLSSKLNLKE